MRWLEGAKNRLGRLEKLGWLARTPLWAAAAALLVVRLLGLGRTLLVLCGAAGGYLLAARRGGKG